MIQLSLDSSYNIVWTVHTVQVEQFMQYRMDSLNFYLKAGIALIMSKSWKTMCTRQLNIY